MDKSWPSLIFNSNSPSLDDTIIDTTSNSDEENVPHKRQRITKRLFFENKKTALKRRKMLDDIRKKFKFKKDEKKRNEEETLHNICDQTENTNYDILHSSASDSSLNEYCLSPTFNSKPRYRKSPILRRKFKRKAFVEMSPVIRRKFRKRKKKKENAEKVASEPTPYYSNIIDDTNNFNNLSSNLEIVNSNSQDSIKEANIENSDNSSIEIPISNSPSFNSPIKVDNEISEESQRTLTEIQNIFSLPSTPLREKYSSNCVEFVYKSSPVKRKFKPKKGTLAFRFQELMKSQKSSVSFWRHEHYLESTSSFKRIVTSEEINLMLNLTVTKIQIEYDRLLLKCSEETRSNDPFLLILNKNFLKTGITENSSFVLHPPYIRKSCNFINNVSNIIFNAHKIVYNNKLISY